MSKVVVTTPDNPHAQLAPAIAQVNSILLGKAHQVRLAYTCLLAGGHLLLEDLPGVGKTTLAHALAVSTGLHFQRVQFTSDLMPSDIIGVSVYERERNDFRFHPGPLFTELLLADEINRGTPKVQSALLEAMAEGQVSVDGKTRPLPETFIVIATQNPLDLVGTFPLPNSQLDRFLMRIVLGYPDPKAERALLQGEDRHHLLSTLEPQLDPQQIIELRRECHTILANPPLLDYLQNLLRATRQHPDIRVGLSPRAGLALLGAARAWAMLGKRRFVIPEDVQAVFVAVAAHRLVVGRGTSGETLAGAVLAEVSIPE